MAISAIVGPGLASCCTTLSVIGVVFLVSLGIGFENNAHVLMAQPTLPRTVKK
ncbi:hypothetical protein H4Q26_016411 [Puccinia striiformis f. sp. tritici PST-130]|nr:hypothetical protein H4Q26_016411 [Puccinia striiformis f. sp. tritici PST-130]